MAHFWRKDFHAVPAPQRRAARYALQIMARCPFLYPRLADDDFLGALWFLALDNALVNSDGYWTRASDYSIYRDEKGIFHILPYELYIFFE